MTDAEIDWSAFVPAETTREFAETARAHFASLDAPALVRRLIDSGEPAGLWPRIAEHGYPAIGVPEALDGVGTLTDLCAVLEEAGRVLLPAPLLATAAAQQTLLAAGALEGDELGMPMALAEPTRDDRMIAFDAQEAERIVAVATHGEGAVVRILPVTDAGTAADDAEAHAVDPSRAQRRIDPSTASHDTTVDASVDTVLSGARICVAADLLGTAAGALDASLDHVRQRQQFGRPIGSFQAVKHALADAYVQIERARSLTLGAAVEADRERLSGRTRRLSMLAKAAASDAALRVTALQVQLLGAMGLTWESDAGLAVRRARHTVPFLGTASDLYARVAREAAEESR